MKDSPKLFTPRIAMPDEIQIRLTYSELGRYFDLTERNGKELDPFQLLVLLERALREVLVVIDQARKGGYALAPSGGEDDGT